MARDQALAVVNAQAVGIRLQRDLGAGKARRHRIAAGLERDAELAFGAHDQYPADIKGPGIDRWQ